MDFFPQFYQLLLHFILELENKFLIETLDVSVVVQEGAIYELNVLFWNENQVPTVRSGYEFSQQQRRNLKLANKLLFSIGNLKNFVTYMSKMSPGKFFKYLFFFREFSFVFSMTGL